MSDFPTSGEVFYDGYVTLNDMHTLLPQQAQPPGSATDWLHPVDGLIRNSNDTMHYNTLHECVHPTAWRVPTNNRITDGSITPVVVDNDVFVNGAFPNWNWSQFGISGPVVVQCELERGAGAGNQCIDIRCNDYTNIASTFLECATDVVSNGFTLHFARSVFTYNTSSYFWITIVIAGGGAYRVALSNTNQPMIQYSPDGATGSFIMVKGMRVAGNTAANLGNTVPQAGAAMNFFSCMVLNNSISINVGGMSEPYVAPVLDPGSFGSFTEPPQTLQDQTISEVYIEAAGFTQIRLSAHGTGFTTSANMWSTPQNLGFAPDPSTPVYYLVYSGGNRKTVQNGVPWNPPEVPTSSITVSYVVGSRPVAPQFNLNITNPTSGNIGGVPYSNQTAIATRVVTKCNGIEDRGTNPPAYVYMNQDNLSPIAPGLVPILLKGARQQVRFDPYRLTVTNSLVLTFDNYHSVQNFIDQGALYGAGNIGVAWNAGRRNIFDPTSTVLWPMFTGFCDTYLYETPTPNQSTLSLVCVDEMQKLIDIYQFSPPNWDGIYHYWAIQELCLMAGLTADRILLYYTDPTTNLQKLINVPDDPFTADPHDPAPYFLPVGAGSHPWTPINRNLPLIDLADQIRKFTGFLMYILPSGQMVYREWIPQGAGAVSRVFGPVSGLDTQDLTEIFSIRGRVSTRNVRNQVSLIGIDGYRPNFSTEVSPFAKMEDSASISSPPGAQPFNYVGYRKPFIMADARFSNLEFTANTLQRLYRFLRQAEVEETAAMWPQYDLYALDIVQFTDPRSQLSDLPLTITGIDIDLAGSNGRLGQDCAITGRYLDLF